MFKQRVICVGSTIRVDSGVATSGHDVVRSGCAREGCARLLIEMSGRGGKGRIIVGAKAARIDEPERVSSRISVQVALQRALHALPGLGEKQRVGRQELPDARVVV